MYSHDELIDIVSAANISGLMEHAGRIIICDDEELLNMITRELGKYNEAADVTMENSNGLNWYDWIEDALVKQYGTDNELEQKWAELSDAPFDDGGTENDMTLAEEWFGFPAGTEREEIWHWFDEHYSKGVAHLLNAE